MRTGNPFFLLFAGEVATESRSIEHKYSTLCVSFLEGVSFLHDRGARGGYPMAQASLTLQLNAANALLRLSKLDEAEERFKHLIDTVSEGEVSFGVMAGLATSSIRQSAHRSDFLRIC